MGNLESNRKELTLSIARPTPTNTDDVEITVREVKGERDTSGKPIVVVFTDAKVLSDIRCMDKDSEVCDTCKVKFLCFTNVRLEIDFNKSLRGSSVDNLDTPLNKAVEMYLKYMKGK